MSRDIIYFVIGSSYGRMAQLVVPTGTFSRMRDVDVNRLLASRSLESTEGSPKNPNILGEIVRIVRIRSHGSVGRAHRSHRWGHRFESCCDHHKTSKAYGFRGFSVSWTSALLPVGGPDRHTISFYQLRSFTNIQNFECAVSFSMLTGWSPISFTRVDVNGSPASM